MAEGGFGVVTPEYNGHFITPRPPEKQTWELAYDDRKKRALDPKVRKQICDEEHFVGTNVSAVWERVRQHCAPGTWTLTHQAFQQFCRSSGLTSEYLAKRLVGIFDKDKTGAIHGLVFLKHLHTMINDPSVDHFVNTAFELFERRPGYDDAVESSYFSNTLKLQDPAIGGKKKKKKKAASSTDVEKQGQITYYMQEAARKCLKEYQRTNPFVVTRADFAKWWECDADLIAAFLCPILEVTACVYFKSDLPKIPNAFYKALDPVEEAPFSDADWWLLKEHDRLGFDPLAKDGKRGKGRAKANK